MARPTAKARELKARTDMGARIRAERISRGYTQARLAKRVGFRDQSQISKIERGTGDVSRRKLELLATEFGVSLDYIVSGTDAAGKGVAELTSELLARATKPQLRALREMADSDLEDVVEAFFALLDAKSRRNR